MLELVIAFVGAGLILVVIAVAARLSELGRDVARIATALEQANGRQNTAAMFPDEPPHDWTPAP